MTFTVLIPARLASTRLPNKPLADLGGVPMVVRVAQRALKSNASRVVVATDSAEIVRQCTLFNIDVVLTAGDHLSGTDRLAEACELLRLADTEVVVNVQGDEPLIDPALIDAVAALLNERGDCAMSTAAHAIATFEDFIDPNVVKVVTDSRSTALYFSRAAIPVSRAGTAGRAWWLGKNTEPPPLRHIGLYAYRAAFLRQFPEMEPAPIERLESLEQLRALWHGHRIAVHVTAHAPGPGVDTPADLERARRFFD